jgi:hypothetical protein
MNVEAALHRIYLWIAGLAAAGTLAALVWRGWPDAVSFAIGSGVAAINFHWIKGAADTMAAKFSERPDAQPPRLVAAKFVLRYAVLGLAGYAIFKYLRVSLPGFLAGLLVVAAAIMAEMVYEISRG